MALKDRTRLHGNQLLTDQDELILVGILLAFDSASTLLSRNCFLEIVRSCFIHDPVWDGSSWFRLFLKRHHNHLTYTATKGLEISRVTTPSVEVIDGFIASLEKLIQQYHFVSELTINANESPVDAMKSISTKDLMNYNARKYYLIQASSEPIRTILPFVSASGKVWMVVYIYLKLGRHRLTKPSNRSISHPQQPRSVELGLYIMQQLTKGL
jgi:hypothetical protein